jgi:hypothetical protein
MKSEEKMIAVCGIDCRSCDIRKVPEDPEAAARVIAWFRKEEWLKENEGLKEIIDRSMYCTGCRGDRKIHWSPDCRILNCCVDKNGYEFCYQCSDFPCNMLVEWAKQDENYAQALDRLQQMKEKQH